MNSFILKRPQFCDAIQAMCHVKKTPHWFELDQLSYTKEINTPSSLKPLKAITNYR